MRLPSGSPSAWATDAILADRLAAAAGPAAAPITDADIDALPAYGEAPGGARPDPFAEVPVGLRGI